VTDTVKILYLGDIVGQPGRAFTRDVLRRIIPELQPDLIVANGENAAHGRGLTKKAAEELYDAGVEMITLGNHTFDQKDVLSILEEDERVVRPLNYPPGTPGQGFRICQVKGRSVLIVNLMGRAFLSQLDCPFRAADSILAQFPEIKHILVDMHAEVTSEKVAMGWYLEGRVSAVVGTHTHVPTNDARVLPQGTAYITDLGMVGPRDGVLGVQREQVIYRLLTSRPSRFEVAEGPCQFCAVEMVLDDDTGRAQSIRSIIEEG
jgi:metallophosphoesterase (TIGR00282 family)